MTYPRTLPATATLGYYTIRLRNGPASDDPDAEAGNGQFRVEHWIKPAKRVAREPGQKRACCRAKSMQVVIDAVPLRRSRLQRQG